MKFILIPLIMGLVGTGAGVGAAMVINRPGGPKVEEDAQKVAPTEFVRLHNEFMVPVIEGDRVDRLMVLTLSVEVDEGTKDSVHEREPKLRDAFLRVMFDHANAGGFDTDFYSSAGIDKLRAALREVAVVTLGPQTRDVLVVDLVQQTL